MTFHDIKHESVDRLFNHFGQLAQIIFTDDNEINALVVHRLPDEVSDIFDSPIHSNTNMFEVRISDIPTANVIGFIELNDKRYRIQGEPMRDQHNLVLKVYADEIESSP